jgi:hypothetical protein
MNINYNIYQARLIFSTVENKMLEVLQTTGVPRTRMSKIPEASRYALKEVFFFSDIAAMSGTTLAMVCSGASAVSRRVLNR